MLSWYDNYIAKHRTWPEHIGIEQWTPHDLRRTIATQLGKSLQIDLAVVEKCLGHKMLKIMATYNKNEMLLHRKKAPDRWEYFVEALIHNQGTIHRPTVSASFVTTQHSVYSQEAQFL